MTAASPPDGVPEDVDPHVAEMVIAIRDRFGVRGLRGARWMIEQEIRLAEDALSELDADG
jgi:hypothetical protein